MIRVRGKSGLEDRRRLLVDRGVPPFVGRSQERQGKERRRVHVVGKGRVEPAHLGEVLNVALGLRAGAEEGLDRAQVGALAFGPTPGDSRRRVRAEALQNPSGAPEILFHPDRMVLRHRLAPERQGKFRIQLLRLAKRPRGVVVLEVVELSQSVEERGLRRWGAGIGKRDVADAE